MGARDDESRTRSGAFWLFHEKMRVLRAKPCAETYASGLDRL
jgi:hypothetical protein